ncbi:VOC family protein [Taibaiella koreensis]|uniref:VOC family protein n=1 Tax=Taibaiella koreensis TaxID=1268548 RepID=UPI000E5A0AC7|nr:glyoxalase/bleomycin resistance/extradiol dioxygenase family protein [Taibaiella koreensis]
MEPITPYLNFNGNAAEALAFYAKAFDGEIVFQQPYGDSPMAGSPDWKDKIMHATFQAGSLTLMVSDTPGPEEQVTAGSNTQLSLNFKHEEDIDRVFAAMSEGARITMPLQDTFWGAKFGMLVDKFDIHWMFNFDRPKEQQ